MDAAYMIFFFFNLILILDKSDSNWVGKHAVLGLHLDPRTLVSLQF